MTKYMLPAVLAFAAGAAFAGGHSPALDLRGASPFGEAAGYRDLQPPWLGANAVALLTAVAQESEEGYLPNDANHAGLSGAASCPALVNEGGENDESDESASCEMCGTSDGADPHAGLGRASDVQVSPVAVSTAPNGHSIADVFARRRELANQRVQVRGVVVKLTEGILDRTYLHLRDGTGSAATNDYDLTVTTREPCALGDVVELSGVLLIDQDLGLGYRYPALLEDAEVAQAPKG